MILFITRGSSILKKNEAEAGAAMSNSKFLISAYQGHPSPVVVGEEGVRLRGVSVLMKLVLLSLLSAGIMSADMVVNFDDLPTPLTFLTETNAYAYVPASYDGFTWVNWEVINQAAYSDLYLDSTPIPSNPNFAFPSPESSTVSMSSATPFVFVGAQFAGWPHTDDPVASSVTVNGYLNGNLIGSETEAITNTVWSSSGGISGAVDTLVFSSGDAYFRMDDVDVYFTPEPATGALIATGLIAIAIVRTRRKIKTDEVE
jgi:hypothetical protein